MAGAGFRTFVDGDILTAAQVNTYLMEQSVMVFADAAARTSAIAAPSEGMITYLADTNAVEKYDGSNWVNVNDNTDAILKTIVDAKGDLIAGTAADTVSRLAVGTNGHVLTADSSTATGLKWAAPASGGLVLLSTASPSGVNNVAFDNVFTSTYRNYFIDVQINGTNYEVLSMRFSTSGVDNSNANYQDQLTVAGGSSLSTTRNTNQTSARAGGVDNGRATGAQIRVFGPQLADETCYQSYCIFSAGASTNTELDIIGGFFNTTTQFDGIKIYAANNFSGQISVYGIED